MTFTFLPALCALAVVVGVARAESHTIKFVNKYVLDPGKVIVGSFLTDLEFSCGTGVVCMR